MEESIDYLSFLRNKRITFVPVGFDSEKSDFNKNLFGWQKDIVAWALRKGRAALFEDCGLGKTIQQLQWAESVNKKTNNPVLIVCPLAVSAQTKREADKFGFENVKICSYQDDVINGTNITNYEKLEHFDASKFSGIILDESSILKNYSGKIKTQIIEMFTRTPYKLSCTATPAPNDYMELGNQAEFLGVMSRTEMLSTFFIHDGANTSSWRLKGHAESEFWKWISTWAVVMTNPSDIGYDGSDYVLPELRIKEVVVESNEKTEGDQLTMYAPAKMTLSERRIARRDSISDRCMAVKSIVEDDNDSQTLIWCDLNAESETISSMIDGCKQITGSDSDDYKVKTMIDFSTGDERCIVTKPSIAGYGMNWQTCHRIVFLGLSDSYEMMYQAIRRCWRFGQKNAVDVFIVISDGEGAVKENIDRKDKQSQKMIKEMVKYTRDNIISDIKSTQRISDDYSPRVKMEIPEWIMEEKWKS